MSDLILEEQRNYTLILRLNRPPVNALSRGMRAAILDALSRAERAGNVHAVVLIARDGLGFCAGADLAESGEIRTSEDAVAVARREVEFCEAVCRFPKPLIAAIDKYALGGGLELSLAADWRLATPTSKVGFPEALLGAFPAGGAVPLLTRLVGRHRTRQLMLTADVLTGERALALGLVDEVVEADTILSRAQALADLFARRAYGSVRAVKALTADARADSHEQIVAWMQQLYAGRDIHEGLRAFREKREPVFDAQWAAPDEAQTPRG